MKKIFLSIFFIFTISYIFLYTQKNNVHKVLQVITPAEIVIDANNNLIFDENFSVNIPDFFYISNKDDISKYNLSENLSQEEILYANYKANEFANKFLKNKFIKYSHNKIYVSNLDYSKQMLDTHFVFDESQESKKLFIENIKSINTDKLYIYNLKTKVYHKISCELGKKSYNYKIIPDTSISKAMKPCSKCILEHLKDTNKFYKTLKKSTIKTSFKTNDIKLFFIDLNTFFKPSNKCKTDACLALKSEIDNSKNTIDFAIYGINNQPEIVNALINAKKRGVKMRWVYDFDKKNINYYPDTLKLAKLIPSYKTDEAYDRENSPAIMHNKFFIFDNNKVWTGSANITSTDLTSFNANYAVLINSPELAKVYTYEFNQMYNGSFHKSKSKNTVDPIQLGNGIKLKPLFSPQDNIIESDIIPLINGATKYIYVPIFFFTSKDIADALISAHNRGVEIKVITDATNAHSKYTVHKQLRAAGIKVKTENYAGKMHMKALIIDDVISVIGSMNFTKSGNLKNDENVLIFYNKELAQFMKNTFLYTWNKIPAKYETFDPKAESLQSIGSCFDGIDNDFDTKIDKDDEGCFIK